MSGPILVTGGTGTLGRVLVPRLLAAGYESRVLSRRPGPGRTVGDLETGAGLDDALHDVTVVVHAATRARRDPLAARQLVEAIRRSGAEPHLLYVSIVGVDRVPFGYYRNKLAVERLVSASGLPWTIQRATQFHSLLDRVFATLALLPVLPVLAGEGLQPVSVGDVADRLVAQVGEPPAGRAPDLGGPQVRPMADFARPWLAARGQRRPVIAVSLPGATARAYRAGGLLTPEHRDGRTTFDRYLADRYPADRLADDRAVGP